MSLKNVHPVRYQPTGVSDTLDATNAFPGAMAALTNLVPAPGTDKCWFCRPASAQLTAFDTFTTPGFESGLLVVGNLAYGLIASARNAGHDEPFCFNLASNTFVTVSGITSGNTPLSPPSSGAWTPPILAVVGTKVVVTSTGFPGGATKFGWFDITNPLAPAWSAGDTAPNALASTPVGVAQMNGRAWYLTGNSITYSDSLAATVVTNATQVLTPANGLACTAIGPVPLGAPLTGGIVQALVVFQGNNAMQQIVGDPTTNNLSLNAIKASTGTLAPLSVTPITNGLAFVSPEGLRAVDASAQVSEPIGDHGTGVTTPFIYTQIPSRICAAANADTIRITSQNANLAGQPIQEWWYDLTRKVWSGPHTFPSSLIQPWGSSFVKTAVGVTAKLWQSDAVPNVNSGYTENGTLLAWLWQTSLLPDNGGMAENNLSEATVALALPSSQTITVLCLDEDNNTLDTITVFSASGSPGVWGTGVWGTMTWGIPSGSYKQYRLPWTKPIVFKQMSVRLSGNSAALGIANLYLKYQVLGYMLQAG